MQILKIMLNMVSLEEILPTKLFEVLERSDICTSKQIMVLSLWDIKKLTNLSNEDIALVKNIISQQLLPGITTVDILYKRETLKKNVTTGCSVIDNFLKGGFRRGTITEIYGESGSGKTQIGIQAATFNWMYGSVYICTEDLFPVKRHGQMQNNLPNFCPSTDYGKHTYVEHIIEPHDLLSCIKIRLPKLLSKQKLALVIIDSIAAPYRVENTNYIQRAEDLRDVAISLLKIAQEHDLAVVCINQVTATFSETVDVMPSLGLAWSNMVDTRLLLRKTKEMYSAPHLSTETCINNMNLNIRELSVEFSSNLPYSICKCIITPVGCQGLNP